MYFNDFRQRRPPRLSRQDPARATFIEPRTYRLKLVGHERKDVRGAQGWRKVVDFDHRTLLWGADFIKAKSRRILEAVRKSLWSHQLFGQKLHAQIHRQNFEGQERAQGQISGERHKSGRVHPLACVEMRRKIWHQPRTAQRHVPPDFTVRAPRTKTGVHLELQSDPRGNSEGKGRRAPHQKYRCYQRQSWNVRNWSQD